MKATYTVLSATRVRVSHGPTGGLIAYRRCGTSGKR
jgi:hypothetical protein